MEAQPDTTANPAPIPPALHIVGPKGVPEPWQVVERIGQGAFSTVYRVRHGVLGGSYALKVLESPFDSVKKRTLQEGRIQAQLRHPNIVRVHDAFLVGGKLALLMEWVDGPTLADILHGETLSMDDAMAIFHQLVAGVSAAHSSGVLHRDLKPENILLGHDRGEVIVKISDFGLAKARDSELEGMTSDGAALGTPGYMAPEQHGAAAQADERSDVFSLGTILYELVSGCPAFRRDHCYLESVKAAQKGSCTPVVQLVPRLPRRIAAAIERAMNPDPRARFASCSELAKAVLGSEEHMWPPSRILHLRNLKRPEAAKTGEGAAPTTAPPGASTATRPDPVQAPLPTRSPEAAFLGFSAGAMLAIFAAIAHAVS